MSLKCLPTIEQPPLRVNNGIDLTNNFSRHTCAVSVEYCVLRPQTEKNT